MESYPELYFLVFCRCHTVFQENIHQTVYILDFKGDFNCIILLYFVNIVHFLQEEIYLIIGDLMSVLTTVPQLFMQVFVSIVWFLDICFSQYLSVFVTCILTFSIKPLKFLFIVL